MIPPFNISGVLPPFDVSMGPTNPAAMSPYPVTISAVVRHFATSPERIDILVGLLNFRAALIAAGVDDGFQWLDGSFVEDAEKLKGRPPGDIDVVTIAHRPSVCRSKASWDTFVSNNSTLFDPLRSKTMYHCDAYFLDLDSTPKYLVESTRYWFGLFSHQRSTALWKGMLQVSLRSDDAAARTILGP